MKLFNAQFAHCSSGLPEPSQFTTGGTGDRSARGCIKTTAARQSTGGSDESRVKPRAFRTGGSTTMMKSLYDSTSHTNTTYNDRRIVQIARRKKYKERSLGHVDGQGYINPPRNQRSCSSRFARLSSLRCSSLAHRSFSSSFLRFISYACA